MLGFDEDLIFDWRFNGGVVWDTISMYFIVCSRPKVRSRFVSRFDPSPTHYSHYIHVVDATLATEPMNRVMNCVYKLAGVGGSCG